jgi:predicted RNA-binding Zn-ribbon protein involved in translation (DUF1610 family)
MTEIGRPYDPQDPDEEHTFTTMVPTDALMPFVDTSGGAQLADREGVWAHSFKCRACTLHFVLFSWSPSRHTSETITCPECGARGRFLHRITQLSTSTTFSLAPDREPEIYDVWPFRLPGDGGNRA